MKQFICVFAAVVLTSLFSTAASANHHWYGYNYGYDYGWGGGYYGGPVVVYGGPVYWSPGPAYWAPPAYYRPRWRRAVYDPAPYWYGDYWGPRW
jgi:hypothetical protein